MKPACALLAIAFAMLLTAQAPAQTSTVVPKKPASRTLVAKPKKPPPPPGECVPGATCTPKPKPDPTTGQVPADPVPADPGTAPEPEPAVPGATARRGTPTPVATTGVAAPTAPAGAAAPDRMRELLIASLDVAEGEAQRAWFAQQGVGVLRRRALVNLGWVLTVYRVPPGMDLQTLLAAFTAQWPQAMPEVNERFVPLSAPGAAATRYAAALIGLPEQGCARPVRLAMLDGPVNLALPGFAARVQAVDIAERSADPAYAHGTGIAALLLGAGDAPGLLPQARVLAANVFAEQGGRSYTTTEWILRGLDWVLGEKPAPVVVNLSFGGPESAQLARAVRRVQQHARVVAAAGNDGATRPIYPAAYPGVVAVTAVDARRRRWPRANAGDFVALAAPGVDVWTLDGAGRGYYASGTSFAAVYVSAALALGAPEQSALETWLSLHAEDLGAPGRDRLFGFGLLHAGGLCAGG
jgi:hypothetical protein